MSYADVAKKGPKQSDEEEIPHAVPEILHDDSAVHTLDKTSGSQHIQAMSYSDQQKASEEVERNAQQLENDAKETADKASREARDFMKRAEESASRLQSKSAKKYQEFTQQAKEDWDKMSSDAQKKYHEFSREAEKQAENAKVEGKKTQEWAEKNQNNPVVIGNAVVITALGALLGTSAYRMHKAGTLTWNVIGMWAGAVGLFAVGDYYVSQWFFKNKYPPKH
ncbi:hypothetical protein BAUCODRAFT_33855 [Baudoinia panamericana UAMH 10762]|uniref:Uncharacterized protein n=1 Tax=Baudoinia panamericana (strain UAMH 10762) TaxID=717646 RepID=M2LQ31_BAUPA|nr:uncharacterized protein BAUCODRAFT_33855 [Baudoinia panamericana UAMH 10762]EMC96492.1 hypothetical protein BAUCODRAFT_33855 [Baudoinia panamericana UAMH 10762]